MVMIVMQQARPSALTTILTLIAILVFLPVLTCVVGGAVFGPGRVTWYRIQGAIAIYLQIALLFTYLYLLLVACIPDAFSQAMVPHEPAGAASLLYFSFVTLTSTGYGDVVPLHPFTRSLANLEAVIGQLFPATLLARLVTLELEARRH
jgi:hypothetical protein